jgi:hypothetical protein
MASKAKGLGLLALVMGLVVMVPSAQAVDIGQFCWTLSGFTDVFRCSVDQRSGSPTLYGLFCSQRAAGSYQLLGAGLARDSFPTTGSIQFSFNANHNTTSFGGNRDCSVTAVISTSTLGGPVSAQCSGTATPFSWSSTFVFAPTCPAGATNPNLPAVGDN